MEISSRKAVAKSSSAIPTDNRDNDERKIILIKDVAETGSQSLELVHCRHPKTGIGATYMFDELNDTLFEVIKFQEDPRSWFIGDSVHKDGGFFIATQMDRLFIFLPYFLNETNKFQPIEQILFDKEFPFVERLLNEECLQQLLLVSDIKKTNDMTTYRYNEEKCMCWLVNKTGNLAKVLESRNIHVGQGSVSATFVKSLRDVKPSKDEYLHYACGLICEYLLQQVSEALMLRMGIPVESRVSSPPLKKFMSQSNVIPDEDYMTSTSMGTIKEKPKKMSSTQKALDKVDKKGIKNISSYFSRNK